MAKYERSIKVAFDQKSGEILEADQVFDTQKNAFVIRKQFHTNEVELHCCECDQRLNVSTSKYDRLHFKHEPHHKFCLLTDGNLSPKEIEEFNRIFLSKESNRHKELKNKIAERLAKTEGIDTNSIAIDNKFIIDGAQKRRPDVYCKYFDKQLVFEIQLSNLSLRYILSRYEFYKKREMYLIWILDNFNVQEQSQLVRDIKYLTGYENFFKLNESVDDFQLDCTYKFPYITTDNTVHTKWVNKSVPLYELSFDGQSYEIYYFNFVFEKIKREEELIKLIQQIKEQEQQRLDQAKLNSARSKARQIIGEIKEERKVDYSFFYQAKVWISELDAYEVEILNQEMDLKRSKSFNKPAINRWINEAVPVDFGFMNFILNCEAITFPVNDTDDNELTCLQETYKNDQLISKLPVMMGLFKRGYQFTKEDRELINNVYPNASSYEPVLYEACARLSDRSLVDTIYQHSSLICILESAKRKSIVGFNYKPDQWASFAINAIQYYKKYWEYIEPAFKKYGIWDELICADRKGTFQKKLKAMYDQMPEQNFDLDPVFRELYQDIFL